MDPRVEEANRLARGAGCAYPSDGATVRCVECGTDHIRRPGWAHREFPSCQACDDKFTAKVIAWIDETKPQ